MADPVLVMQRQTRPQEGLAMTWDAVEDAGRYAFIVGLVAAAPPPLDVIMRGGTREFALLGIPTRFTGAVDLGSPAGDERQYALVAYRADGSVVPVPNLRFHTARRAPRDREFYSLLPPALEREAPATPADRPARTAAASDAARQHDLAPPTG